MTAHDGTVRPSCVSPLQFATSLNSVTATIMSSSSSAGSPVLFVTVMAAHCAGGRSQGVADVDERRVVDLTQDPHRTLCRYRRGLREHRRHPATGLTWPVRPRHHHPENRSGCTRPHGSDTIPTTVMKDRG